MYPCKCRNEVDVSHDDFLAESAVSERSLALYQHILDRFTAWLQDRDPAHLGVRELREFIVSTGWGNSMQYVTVSLLRRYLTWQYGAGHPAARLKVKRKESPPQRSLTVEQVNVLLGSFPTWETTGTRDLALACLLLDTGLREAEICRLELDRVDVDGGRLDALVKGGRWKTAVFGSYTANCLRAWIGARSQIARPGVATMFVGVGGTKRGTPITPSGLRCIMRIWAKRVGFTISPHDFRRTFACLTTEAGAPSRVLQAAGRWENIAMVERYTRNVTQEAVRPYLPVDRLMCD